MADSFDGVLFEKDLLPRHIAFIMDGNGRWASGRSLPRNAGHRAGSERLMEIALECARIGLPHMSVYAFSTENWKRSYDEVQGIMSLAVEFFKREAKNLSKHNIKANFMGDITVLPKATYRACLEVLDITKDATGMVLNIGLNYGGRAEIARAAREIAGDVLAGKLSQDEIGEETVSDYLYTAGQPDVDILVRTGNERRLSGFMLYQCSYAEIFICDEMWPDFTTKKLEEILCNYKKRNRRFGSVPKPQQT
ncbi:MAG: polyprenyl diphosphate synthase [Christensenellales bacterium]|jgi:undecaprenyl diphosphate synthase